MPTPNPLRTSPSRRPGPARRRPARRSAGFTLVELLVVLGMILVLIALLLPAISGARTRALRTRMAADLQAIVAALEAYRQDHGDIPRTSPDGAVPTFTTVTSPPNGRVTEGYAGAQILCRALLGPGNQMADGAGTGANGRDPSLGFRTRPAIPNPDTGTPQGKVYGPYLSQDKFRIANPDGTTANLNANIAVLIDSEDKPILYYPGLPKARISGTSAANAAYAAKFTYGAATPPPPRPMFDLGDNELTTPPLTAAQHHDAVQLILGDTNKNGFLDQGSAEAPAFKGPFLLLSAGPDRRFGPRDRDNPISAANQCDDVTNFDRSPTQ